LYNYQNKIIRCTAHFGTLFRFFHSSRKEIWAYISTGNKGVRRTVPSPHSIALTIKGALVSSIHAKITIDHLYGLAHLAFSG
jgi:hypothetical protein